MLAYCAQLPCMKAAVLQSCGAKLQLHLMSTRLGKPTQLNHPTCPLPPTARYTALLYRAGSTATPLATLNVVANGTTASGTTSFTEELTLPAGPYQLEIATANVHGAGAKTATSAEFTVGECGWGCIQWSCMYARLCTVAAECAAAISAASAMWMEHLSLHLHVDHAPAFLPTGISSVAAIVNGTGSTAGAELQVLRPGNMSDDAVATYLVQAYSDENGNTKARTGILASALHAAWLTDCCLSIQGWHPRQLS